MHTVVISICIRCYMKNIQVGASFDLLINEKEKKNVLLNTSCFLISQKGAIDVVKGKRDVLVLFPMKKLSSKQFILLSVA